MLNCLVCLCLVVILWYQLPFFALPCYCWANSFTCLHLSGKTEKCLNSVIYIELFVYTSQRIFHTVSAWRGFSLFETSINLFTNIYWHSKFFKIFIGIQIGENNVCFPFDKLWGNFPMFSEEVISPVNISNCYTACRKSLPVSYIRSTTKLLDSASKTG